jgi:hypothetical protein
MASGSKPLVNQKRRHMPAQADRGTNGSLNSCNTRYQSDIHSATASECWQSCPTQCTHISTQGELHSPGEYWAARPIPYEANGMYEPAFGLRELTERLRRIFKIPNRFISKLPLRENEHEIPRTHQTNGQRSAHKLKLFCTRTLMSTPGQENDLEKVTSHPAASRLSRPRSEREHL